MRLKGKVYIVTGKEIAQTFVREGARVAIADLNQKAADATATEFGGAGKALGVAMDVTNDDRTVQQFGRVDILCYRTSCISEASVFALLASAVPVGSVARGTLAARMVACL